MHINPLRVSPSQVRVSYDPKPPSSSLPSDRVQLGSDAAPFSLSKMTSAVRGALTPNLRSVRVTMMGVTVAAGCLPALIAGPAHAAGSGLGASLDIRSVISDFFNPKKEEAPVPQFRPQAGIPTPQAKPAVTTAHPGAVPTPKTKPTAPWAGNLQGAAPKFKPQPGSIPAEMFTTDDPGSVARQSSVPKADAGNLKLGMSGPAVARFQKGLSGYVPVQVTGTFDAETEAAVREFQSTQNIPVTGEVGNITKAQLWNKTFWEKGQALDFNGGEVVRNAPANVRLRVDLKAQRVFVLDAATGDTYKSYPVSSGSAKHPTPKMDFTITDITEKPLWIPPATSAWAKGAKVAKPGIGNPLGPVKMRLNGSSVLFHGVPKKEWPGIGHQAESHGCMRMFPQDAWELHNIIGVGTKGQIL